MKLKVSRFRTRKSAVVPLAATARRVIGDDAFMPDPDDDGFGGQSFATARRAPAAANDIAAPMNGANAQNAAPQDMDTIRREGLTGRQLRMARRMALKHGLPATSDFDAVRLLRQSGIDPFQRSSVLELVASNRVDQDDDDDGGAPPSRALTLSTGDGVRLPQIIKPIQVPSTEMRAEESHIAEVGRIQRDMMARRRRKQALLLARMAMFVFLPTFLAGWYYFLVATPLYSAHTEFLIQQSEPAAQAGLGSLLRGSPIATSQDSVAVQGYLQSPEAMERLDLDQGFRKHFSNPAIDPIQRLDPDASNSKVYKMFKSNVKISYDPTEGVIKMDVSATDPQTSVKFSKALIHYAEGQVDHLTTRLRADQMAGAQESFDDAQKKMLDAQRALVGLQEKFKTISSEAEVGLITSQIAALNSQLTQDRLSLAQMQSNASPNKARMDPVIRRIATVEQQISDLRATMTESNETGQSLAEVQSELLVAQADVGTRQLMLAQSLAAVESARIEANRQTRYLSLSVNPVAPDDPTYPRAFEDTLVVMLIFAGIYLMISMTIAILREQVTA